MDSFLSLFNPTSDDSNCNDRLIALQDSENQYFVPEPQNGNIEYKLKLINPTQQRFQHLVTQMKWRLYEGSGLAIYKIGVEDNGLLKGLDSYEMNESLKTINLIAKELNATVKEFKNIDIDSQKCVKELKIEQYCLEKEMSQIRIALFGSVDSGKSTLIGVLTYGDLDNGTGKARLNMFQYVHEVKSGHTSSISTEILGFDLFNNLINYRSRELITAEQIYNDSSKVITFIDLAGHQKYFKTAIHGLCAYFPDFVILTVSSSSKFNVMTEQMSLLTALAIPFFVVISKIDLVKEQKIHDFFDQFKMQTPELGVIRIIDDLDDPYLLRNDIFFDNVVPVFMISSVTGKGINILTKFLSKLQPRRHTSEIQVFQEDSVTFKITKTYQIRNVGTVVAGFLTTGVIEENAKLWLGPAHNGSFTLVSVYSIHRNKVRVKIIKASQSATICFHKIAAEDVDTDACRGGMVLIDYKSTIDYPQNGIYVFKVQMTYNSSILIRSQDPVMIFIENIRQSVRNIRHKCGSESHFVLRFQQRPEFIQVVGRSIRFESKNGDQIWRLMCAQAANCKLELNFKDSGILVN